MAQAKLHLGHTWECSHSQNSHVAGPTKSKLPQLLLLSGVRDPLSPARDPGTASDLLGNRGRNCSVHLRAPSPRTLERRPPARGVDAAGKLLKWFPKNVLSRVWSQGWGDTYLLGGTAVFPSSWQEEGLNP